MKIILRSCIPSHPLSVEDANENVRYLRESGLIDAGREDIVEEDRRIFEFIADFVATHSHVPNFQTIREHFTRANKAETVDRLELIAGLRPLRSGDFVRRVIDRIEDRNKSVIKKLLMDSATVLERGLEVEDGRYRTTIRGPEAALTYIAQRASSLLIRPRASTQSAWTTLDQIEEQTVEWLWPGRIPQGELTLIEGQGASGKSTIARYLAAHVTAGTSLPGTTTRTPGKVIWLSTEEDAARVLRARLRVAGADLSRITIRRTDSPRWTSAAADEIAKIITVGDLLVLDPIKGHLGGLGKGGDWSEVEVRAALDPLVRLAHATGATVVGIRHWKKGATSAAERGAGSTAYRDVARATLVVGAHEGQSYVAVDKCSLGEAAAALAFTFVQGDDGLPRITWGGESESVSADDLAAARRLDPEERSALDEAVAFLEAVLDAGPCDSEEIKRQAKAAGVSERTLDRAKAKIGARSKRIGGRDGRWLVCLPGQDAVDLTTCEPLELPDPNVVDELIDALDESPPSEVETARLAAEPRATGREVVVRGHHLLVSEHPISTEQDGLVYRVITVDGQPAEPGDWYAELHDSHEVVLNRALATRLGALPANEPPSMAATRAHVVQ